VKDRFRKTTIYEQIKTKRQQSQWGKAKKGRKTRSLYIRLPLIGKTAQNRGA
jgi:hypothetical protein